MENIKYTYLLAGQRSFMKTGIEAIESELAPVLEDSDWEESGEELKSNEALLIDTKPKMDMGITSILGIGLVVFVTQWSGKKLLDEIYERTLKAPIGKLLDKVFMKTELPENKLIEYNHIISIEDIGVIILVRLLMKSEDEVSRSLDKITDIHLLAAEWIDKNGKGAPIHCYTIENGDYNIKPIFYNSLLQVQQEETQKNRLDKLNRA